jgi:hypothetical protein
VQDTVVTQLKEGISLEQKPILLVHQLLEHQPILLVHQLLEHQPMTIIAEEALTISLRLPVLIAGHHCGSEGVMMGIPLL